MSAGPSLDPQRLTAREAKRLLVDGEISAAELTKIYLDRIAAVESKVRAYIQVTAENAARKAMEQGLRTVEVFVRGPGAGREAAIRALHAAGDLDGATTAAIKLYGAEVFGFLVALQRSETDANEAFSMFVEKLWRTMSTFAWQCSLRSWVYCVARSVASDERRARIRRDRKLAPIPNTSGVAEIAARVRTGTVNYLKTAVKDEIAKLRESLPTDDQELLILRVDRNLEWKDLARVFLEDSDDPAALTREAARLRKRFQAIKDKLTELARERGLLDDA